MTLRSCARVWPKGVCTRAHTPDKDNVGLSHVLVYVGAEKQVASTCLLHHRIEARLVDGQRVTVPGIDALLVDVHHHHLNLGTF